VEGIDMNIELVIFGFVGTTVLDDGLVSSSLREAVASADVAASDEAIERVAGLASPRAVCELLESARGGKGTWGADEVQRVHADFVRRLIARASRDEPLRETLGASRAFWQLRQDGIRVGSVTGLSLSSAAAIHERLGWRVRGLVDVFVTSDEVERGAPEPDAIFEIMQRAGVRESARVAFVGNATSELEQASAAGCGLVVGVFDSDGSFGRVRAAPHNVLLPTCALVPELLRRISARRIAPIAMGSSS
jgi:phosphonatase-like hydrolase